MDFSDQLSEILKAMDIHIAQQTVDNLARYNQLLYEANKRMNLTGIHPDEAALLSFADSLTTLPHLPTAGKLLDVGCGAGFPGLVIAIACPTLHCTLLDATRKKVDFVTSVITALQLPNAVALQGRAEVLGSDPAYREQFDVCVARAVAPLATLAEYCLPFVKVRGQWLAFKGASVQEEIAAAHQAMRMVGGGEFAVFPARLPGRDHSIVRAYKRKPSPDIYPRKVGDAPRKKPLVF